jgi:hypothetical protein
MAGSAPGRPEIDQHRPVGAQDFLFKICLVDGNRTGPGSRLRCTWLLRRSWGRLRSLAQEIGNVRA